MSTIPAINTGTQGIHQGINGLKRNAHDTATLNTQKTTLKVISANCL